MLRFMAVNFNYLRFLSRASNRNAVGAIKKGKNIQKGSVGLVNKIRKS